MKRDKLIDFGLQSYIKLIERTSKVEFENKELVFTENGDKYLAVFWHENSYCLYPTLRGLGVAVITTSNKRGDYIANMCREYGYKPLRVPDEARADNPLFKLAREINASKDYHVALAMDGPLGPYREPKAFAFVLAEMTKRDILPVTVEVKRKLILFRRWDKFKIPLPFSHIKVTFNEPIKLSKQDRLDSYVQITDGLKKAMEHNSN